MNMDFNFDIAPMDMSKKVCIIVPVYNAEQFLGYCLNSLMSQTYTNWTAILVDDGSTDRSLEICNNYARVDSRFQVYSIPNGGVSQARNFGLSQAEGDYLAFVDSDDCLALETLERQVKAAEHYGSQLIISDILQADFTNPGQQGSRMTSAWLKKKPAVLDGEAFRSQRMRLIWFTALLEGPTGKLYSLPLWKQLQLQFCEELSLGEDFVANMQYYEACGGAVFLGQIGYYYNNYAGSESLTHKYRPDLFENKMYLMNLLKEHLERGGYVSDEEWDAFHNYVSMSVLGCMRDMLDNAPDMKPADKAARLAQMCGDSLFMESLNAASYRPEQFAGWHELLQQKKYKDLIKLAERTKVMKPVEQKPSFMNRAVRKVMRTVGPAMGSTMAERMNRWEQEIAVQGVRNTVSAHRRSKKKATTYQLESASRQLTEAVADAQWQMNTAMAAHEKRLSEQIDKNRDMLYDNMWHITQRMQRDRYWDEVNILRQKKKALMLATAEHENIGDSAITMAEQELLMEQFPEYYQVEISTYMYDEEEAYLHAILHPDDIIFINGGGNMGDRYPAEEALHRRIVEDFPDHRIVIFPQTTSFSDTPEGRAELEKSAKVYNRHENLTLFVRGEKSLRFVRENFSNVHSYLMPDVVHVLRTHYHLDRSGALLCLRGDVEGILDAEQRETIEQLAKMNFNTLEYSTNMNGESVFRDARALVVRRELKKFASHEIVVTDRLHGMIFAAITDTPCVVLSSYNYKIQEYYEAFFADSNAVFFVGNDLAKLEQAMKQAKQVKTPEYPIFAADPHRSFRALCMGE